MTETKRRVRSSRAKPKSIPAVAEILSRAEAVPPASVAKEEMQSQINNLGMRLRHLVGLASASPTAITLSEAGKIEAFLTAQVAHAMRSIHEIVARDPGIATQFSFDMDIAVTPLQRVAQRLGVPPRADVALPAPQPVAAPQRRSSGTPVGRMVGSKEIVLGDLSDLAPPPGRDPTDDDALFLAVE